MNKNLKTIAVYLESYAQIKELQEMNGGCSQAEIVKHLLELIDKVPIENQKEEPVVEVQPEPVKPIVSILSKVLGSDSYSHRYSLRSEK
jgi:hypothetical protein